MTTNEFLNGYPQNLREIADFLRSLVKSIFPHATEKIIVGWKVIGYRLPAGNNKTIYFCCIAPQRKEHDVLLGFTYGVAMQDPRRIMEGKGTQVRFVRMRSIEDHSESDLVWLIEEAANVALQRF